MKNENTVLARNTSMAPINTLNSQSVAFSHYNNLSAQLPIDPNTNKLVPGGVKEQANQCFKNIETIVESIGHVMNDIVRVTIFVMNMKDLEQVEAVYQTYFTNYFPALTIVGVNELPCGALVQIEALVSNGEGTIPNAPQAGDLVKLTNQTSKAPTHPLSSQTVAFSHYNNLSAQLPIDPKTGRINSTDIKEQTKQTLANIKAILESIEVPLDDIVKTTIFLKNYSDLDEVNEVYRAFFPDSGIARAVNYFPARTVVCASELLMNALIQIEVVVSHGDGTPPQAIEDRHGLIIEANNTTKAPLDTLATQTVAFSHYNNISAQLPINPMTNKIVSGGIKEQTEQVLKNIQAIIESVDHTLDDVVKINIFMENLSEINVSQMNEVYLKYFPEGIPARRLVGVSELPQGALIQIDAIVGNAEGTPPIV